MHRSRIFSRLIPQPPTKEVVPATTPSAAASPVNTTPVPAATWAVEERKSEPTYVDWGCEETKRVNLSVPLQPRDEYVSAQVVVSNLDKAKSQRTLEPSFNAATRTVTGGAEFTGLDRVLFNCPGGGHATVQLVVTVRLPGQDR